MCDVTWGWGWGGERYFQRGGGGGLNVHDFKELSWFDKMCTEIEGHSSHVVCFTERSLWKLEKKIMLLLSPGNP